jgi:hypothetical protein
VVRHSADLPTPMIDCIAAGCETRRARNWRLFPVLEVLTRVPKRSSCVRVRSENY